MSQDPDIESAWRDLRAGIAAELRPFVIEHQVDAITLRIVADHIAAPGWKPPLRKPPEIIATARAASTRTALEREDTP